MENVMVAKRPADWVIQRVLNETATSEEARLVALWLATDEGHEWLSRQMDRDAEALTEGRIPLAEDIQNGNLLHRIDRIILRSKRRSMLFRVAAVLIPAALIIGLWFNLNSRLGGLLFSQTGMQEVASMRAERKEIIFQDGSKVYLNAQTRISYPEYFGIKERRIVLDGEAYFEVSSNARRPFVVQVGNAEVTVRGTRFNVKAYEQEPTVEVVLLEGAVGFSYGNQNFDLKPSQKLVLDKIGGYVHIRSEENARRAVLWREEILSFRDTPLKEVTEVLARWYDVEFEICDAEAYDYTFTLQTPLLPLAELLDEMQRISSARFVVNDNKVSVYR